MTGSWPDGRWRVVNAHQPRLKALAVIRGTATSAEARTQAEKDWSQEWMATISDAQPASLTYCGAKLPQLCAPWGVTAAQDDVDEVAHEGIAKTIHRGGRTDPDNPRIGYNAELSRPETYIKLQLDEAMREWLDRRKPPPGGSNPGGEAMPPSSSGPQDPASPTQSGCGHGPFGRLEQEEWCVALLETLRRELLHTRHQNLVDELLHLEGLPSPLSDKDRKRLERRRKRVRALIRKWPEEKLKRYCVNRPPPEEDEGGGGDDQQ